MNPFKLTLLAVGLYSGAYLLLFLMWGALLVWGKAGPEQAQYVAYIHDGLLILTSHILTILNASPPPPPTGAVFAGPASTQSGFARPAMMIALAIGSLLLMTGCASLQFAGNASYHVKPVVVDAKTGVVVCCEVVIQDGKERASLDVHVVKDGDKYDITLSEKAVTAFEGQKIAAGAAQGAIDAAAKVAVAAALGPILPALIPAAGAVLSSGAAGAVVGGAALGVAADKMLAPAQPAAVPK